MQWQQQGTRHTDRQTVNQKESYGLAGQQTAHSFSQYAHRLASTRRFNDDATDDNNDDDIIRIGNALHTGLGTGWAQVNGNESENKNRTA